MEQAPQAPLAPFKYKVVWHPDIEEDFLVIDQKKTLKIIEAAEHRLSMAPQFIGQPLKGTTNLLWKIAFSKYRLIYTLNVKAKEVWILSVKKRDVVYRDENVQSLLKLAFALQQQIETEDK